MDFHLNIHLYFTDRKLPEGAGGVVQFQNACLACKVQLQAAQNKTKHRLESVMQARLTGENTKPQTNQMKPWLIKEQTASFPPCFLGLAEGIPYYWSSTCPSLPVTYVFSIKEVGVGFVSLCLTELAARNRMETRVSFWLTPKHCKTKSLSFFHQAVCVH